MENPDFSIVVPTHRRLGPLRNCLKALAAMDYPGNRYEVLVVNDGGPFMKIEDLISPGVSTNFRVINQSNRGPAYARNVGASRASGDIIAFTDDDCAPSRKWLKALKMVSVRGNHCAVGGRTVNQLKDNPYSAASQMVVDFLYDTLNKSPEKARFLASNNLAVPKDRFMDMGGFDTGFTRAAGEDRDFCRRWVRLGYPMIYLPDAVVYHAHELDFSGYLRQHFNYGRGAIQFHRGEKGDLLNGLGSFSFYMRLLRFPLAQPGIATKCRMTLLITLSQVATAIGFLTGIRPSVSPVRRS